MTDNKTIKVMIVDDHPIVRDGMKNMLMVFDDLEFTAEAENGRAALAGLRQGLPDVILMDIVMPEMGGIPATRAILEQYPQVKIIMLTSYPEDDLIQESLEAGAMGFLLKNASINTLANAIRSVYAGQACPGTGSDEGFDAHQDRPPEAWSRSEPAGAGSPGAHGRRFEQ